jgi:hypothetical protein
MCTGIVNCIVLGIFVKQVDIGKVSCDNLLSSHSIRQLIWGISRLAETEHHIIGLKPVYIQTAICKVSTAICVVSASLIPLV